MTPQPTPDVRLVERMAAGDRDAHEEFCERHRLSLYAQAYALLIDATAAERVVVEALGARGRPRGTSNPGRRERVRLAVRRWSRSLAELRRRPPQEPTAVAFSSALAVGRREGADAQYIRPLMSTPLAPAADRWGPAAAPARPVERGAVLVGSTIGGGIFRDSRDHRERVPAPSRCSACGFWGACSRCAGALTTPSWPRCSPARAACTSTPGRVRAAAGVSVRLDGVLLIRASRWAPSLLRSPSTSCALARPRPEVEPNATYVHYVAAGAKSS